MKSNQETSKEFRSTKDIIINLIWLSKFTIIITFSAFVIYSFNNDKVIFELLTAYGLIIAAYFWLLNPGRENDYGSYYSRDILSQVKKFNRPERDEHFSQAIFFSIKGIIVMIIGISMIFTI